MSPDNIWLKGNDPMMHYDAEEAIRFQDQLSGKKLILTVGLPYSGKSTWARNHGASIHAPIVNRDAIRIALHNKRFDVEQEPRISDIEETMVRALFLAGHEIVILDACHVTEDRRARWKTGEWEILYKEFKTLPDTCIDRAMMVDDAIMVPVINRMWKEWEILGPNEKGL